MVLENAEEDKAKKRRRELISLTRDLPKRKKKITKNKKRKRKNIKDSSLFRLPLAFYFSFLNCESEECLFPCSSPSFEGGFDRKGYLT